MLQGLPSDGIEFQSWTWADIRPHYEALDSVDLKSDNVESWLASWSKLASLVTEVDNRLYVATTVNTADANAKGLYDRFLEDIYPNAKEANQRLKKKLLDSGLAVPGFEIPLRNMRSEAELYREENIPLLTEQIKLCQTYDEIVGSQTAVWDGEEVPLPFLNRALQETDRSRREQAWRASIDRKLQDRERLNRLWAEIFGLRGQIAANAGLGSFRDYIWRDLLRFDYSPADCADFREAIAQEVVPVAARILERRRQALGVDSLRPWDLEVDVSGTPLKPFSDGADLIAKSQTVLDHVDPELGGFFADMHARGLLDLESRKNKAPGGYCTNYDAVRLPFIFMNAVGTHDDVQTLIHEAGHSFHVYETAGLPYQQQLAYTSEIAEVASMGMELLAAPYLAAEGAFYTPEEAAKARIKHMETTILFWPYMAVVDGFQHWAYENPDQAVDASACDAEWGRLWSRFMPVVDWSGLEDARVTGWHRKLHIYQVPFYYVEYGMASLGACQVFRNARENQEEAVVKYRSMLRLGGTKPLPELFAAAGAKFAFDAKTIRDCVGILETAIEELSK